MNSWVGVVPWTVHKKLYFWNKDGKLEVVEAYHTSYRIYPSFANESDKTLSVTTPFKIEDSCYVNKKTREDANKYFYWDPKRGFLLNFVEKMATIEDEFFNIILELYGSNFGLHG